MFLLLCFVLDDFNIYTISFALVVFGLRQNYQSVYFQSFNEVNVGGESL